MNEKLRRALEALAAACEKRDGVFNRIDEADDDTPEEDVAALHTEFDEAQAEVERCKTEHGRIARIMEARDATPLPELPEVEAETRHARVLGSTKEEPTYRPDRLETSYFRDILNAKVGGSLEARERLTRNNAEAIDEWKKRTGVDYRDMANASTTGGDFVPTIYLNELWVKPSIAKRPFADELQKYPLPASGTTLSIPHLSSGVTVAGRADNAAVSETDGVTASITHDVNELAGQVDIGRVAVFRSEPGLDVVIGETLIRRYNALLDTYCLSGTGTAPQHRGLRAVSSVNTRSYTDASPTAQELTPVIWNAAADIATNRSGEVQADAVVMHHRRAAFLGGGLGTTVPVIQQGQLIQAVGTQDQMFTTSLGGLKVILDASIGVTYGASTNEDEIYVVAMSDLYLAEGPLFSRVFEDVGSGTGTIRFQVFAYSSFLSKRYPKSITVISGTGLVAP